MAASAASSSAINISNPQDDEAIIVLEASDISAGFDRCSKSLVCGKETSIVKVKVLLDVTKPLRRSLKISGPNQKVFEIGIRYERIGIFCNYCGHVGHEIRNCSTQIDDSLKGEGGRRVTTLKENIQAITNQVESSIKSKSDKPVPVNLIKSLAGLSVASKTEKSNEDDSEALSKANPPQPSMMIVSETPLQPVRPAINHENQNEFVFTTNVINSENSSQRVSLKQQARKKFIKVSGTKRSSTDNKNTQACKKLCSTEVSTAEEGEGATPQWAPNPQ
ncbi:hypothetical protein PIB30_034635 [Stylosanthes scabra]|uniref:Zinc knuckle CX2CX4HX4C domain-containing protein n=1 Tax=Stylosanthes scabra TaxID=79078 RepID=A0ABU6YDI5_9FABA|nr:hypothetical protein [Stylosanthes scabra]